MNREINMEKFHYNRIQEVLEEKNKDVYWLQSQLEGQTIPCVVRWCKNVKQPTIEEIFEIARVLEVDVRELLASTTTQKISSLYRNSVETLNHFQGKDNVRHIVSDNGSESWLTQEISFADETCAKGACKLNTVENETKHVLFLFNNKNEEVGRYYIGKKLQGKTPDELITLKSNLSFFESWNPESKSWVPCVSLRDSMSEEDQKIQNEREESDFDVRNKLGIEPIYRRLEVKKRKLAIEYCKAMLNKVDNWRKLYENAKRCLSRSSFYGYKIVESDLSTLEKTVFFWKVIETEIENRPKEFFEAFPESNHKYTEENFKRLYDYVLHSKHWWTKPVNISNRQSNVDGETSIMSALENGSGDDIGF